MNTKEILESSIKEVLKVTRPVSQVETKSTEAYLMNEYLQLLISKFKLSKTISGDMSSMRKYENPKMMALAAIRGGGMWTTVSSSIAAFRFLLVIIQQYFPSELRSYLLKYIHRVISSVYPYIQISLHEFRRDTLRRNEAYVAVDAYLSEKTSRNAKNLRAETAMNNSNLVLRMDDNEMCTDDYCGTKVSWSLNKEKPSNESMRYFDKRYYSLTFPKSHSELITESYLEHVLKEGRAIVQRNRRRKLFTNSLSNKHIKWSPVVFEHPASFQTLAMDPEKKKEIVDDLLSFRESKDYYAKIGKAWKRGYLLYGPPGCGKSTIIAAMAKLLEYDIYDLELTAVKDNSELRELLIEISNKSILVIEDIDCSLDLTGRRKSTKNLSNGDDREVNKITERKKENEESKVTLSGLLNFVDGLWSVCGEERLIVFTTNYLDKLDPALIRRGRMDKHIELSYCSFEAFKVLARNYLDLESHPLFETIHELIMKNKMTPADVAENLMRKSTENAETCLKTLIQALEKVKEDATVLAKEKEEATGLREELKDEKSVDPSTIQMID